MTSKGSLWSRASVHRNKKISRINTHPLIHSTIDGNQSIRVKIIIFFYSFFSSKAFSEHPFILALCRHYKLIILSPLTEQREAEVPLVAGSWDSLVASQKADKRPDLSFPQEVL